MLHAARTEDDALVEVFVVRVLWVQTSSKSAVFRRATIRVWKRRRVQDTAEFTIIWHCKLGRRLNWSMGSGSHGSMLPRVSLLLSPQKNWHLQLVSHEMNNMSSMLLLTKQQHLRKKVCLYWCLLSSCLFRISSCWKNTMQEKINTVFKLYQVPTILKKCAS